MRTAYNYESEIDIDESADCFLQDQTYWIYDDANHLFPVVVTQVSYVSYGCLTFIYDNCHCLCFPFIPIHTIS